MFAGSRAGQALPLDGVARLRLVLSSTCHFGFVHQRRLSLHDHVGEYITETSSLLFFLLLVRRTQLVFVR